MGKVEQKTWEDVFIPPKHGDGLKSVFVCLFVSYLFIGAVVCFFFYLVYGLYLRASHCVSIYYLVFLGIYIQFT